MVERIDVPYILKIKNRNSEGGKRASSALVKLNGVVVAGAEQLNQQVAEIVITVRLESANVGAP